MFLARTRIIKPLSTSLFNRHENCRSWNTIIPFYLLSFFISRKETLELVTSPLSDPFLFTYRRNVNVFAQFRLFRDQNKHKTCLLYQVNFNRYFCFRVQNSRKVYPLLFSKKGIAFRRFSRVNYELITIFNSNEIVIVSRCQRRRVFFDGFLDERKR